MLLKVQLRTNSNKDDGDCGYGGVSNAIALRLQRERRCVDAPQTVHEAIPVTVHDPDEEQMSAGVLHEEVAVDDNDAPCDRRRVGHLVVVLLRQHGQWNSVSNDVHYEPEKARELR